MKNLLLNEFNENGIIVIRGMFSGDECDTHNSLVEIARSKIQTSSSGLGDRIGQLHQEYPDIIRRYSGHP
jgi:hypothetical protein